MSEPAAEIKAKVAITSSFTGQRWEGSVDLDVTSKATSEQKLNRLFRLFNVVDEDDVRRLEAIGYRQPSLSTGDAIELDGERWQVAPVGFAKFDED